MSSEDKCIGWIVTIIGAVLIAITIGVVWYNIHALNLYVANGYQEATFEGTANTRWQKVK